MPNRTSLVSAHPPHPTYQSLNPGTPPTAHHTWIYHCMAVPYTHYRYRIPYLDLSLYGGMPLPLTIPGFIIVWRYATTAYHTWIYHCMAVCHYRLPYLDLSLYGGMPTTTLSPASSSSGATSTSGRPVTFLFFEDAMWPYVRKCRILFI
jgi:hypothetical protein